MNLFTTSIDQIKSDIDDYLKTLTEDERIDAINDLREHLHKLSPIREPVDLVRWVPAESVVANDYNPNKVAPPEMKLLYLSIKEDGYTQPIVCYDCGDGTYEVVDGFHRNRVGKEHPDVRRRIMDRLPIVVIDKPVDQRMASTIRHNRARGKHGVLPMSELVAVLYRDGWADDKIAKHLGMDLDEVLRLKQVTGLPDIFKEREFSKGWE